MTLLTIIASFFFFNDTATTEIYTLSLHDALPILPASASPNEPWRTLLVPLPSPAAAAPSPNPAIATTPRAPPVPLPAPAPTGRSNAPRLAMLTALSARPSPFAPLGSPKPPVCTRRGGSFVVAGVSVGNTFVLTSGFGAGGGAGGSGIGIFF